MEQVEVFVNRVEAELLKGIRLKSEKPYDPVVVKHVPAGWRCIGAGNYAAVFTHQANDSWVVKVYARGSTEAISKEAEMYKRLGRHSAYSELIYQGKQYLVLRRLKGITLYEAIHKGVRIPQRVIDDVGEALTYARACGLTPSDVHGKNVMMHEGRGYVVDISDFYKCGDKKWEDIVKAYYRIYRPFLYKHPIPVPYFLLDAVRHMYRLYRKWSKSKHYKSSNLDI